MRKDFVQFAKAVVKSFLQTRSALNALKMATEICDAITVVEKDKTDYAQML